ncbi:cold shock domain-containing protein [Streptomyces sp. NPDC045431]|uniref:cold-shock protein n=1 Tax=Streptomyces sp. NPDC045431 TaxID=3155613 RepID=UPI0033FC83E0
MPSGVVKWFDSDQGVGMICQGRDQPEVLAELSAVRGPARRLVQGDRVLFDITFDAAGRRADNIHRLPD